jgi:hypothetical protein
MAHRYFTLPEAEASLPKVRLHVEKLMSIHDELSALSGVKVHAERIDWEAHLLAININKRYHELSFKYFAELEALTKMGCYVKDVTLGLVDFYSRFENRDILLCWKFDEPEILYYHDETSGKSGRIPIAKIKELFAAQQRALL